MAVYGEDNSDAYEHNRGLSIHPYNGRNYDLFAVLADVRNDDGYIPIDSPRGLPDDVSTYVKNASDEWDINGHSHSWLSLDELERYPWYLPHVVGGIVNVREFQTFLDEGRPKSWCAGVGGANVEIVDNVTMAKVARGAECDPNKVYYTAIQWSWPIQEAVGSFFTKTMPALRDVATKKGVDDVRIVFWFDN